jgi:hypothetical protein
VSDSVLDLAARQNHPGAAKFTHPHSAGVLRAGEFYFNGFPMNPWTGVPFGIGKSLQNESGNPGKPVRKSRTPARA